MAPWTVGTQPKQSGTTAENEYIGPANSRPSWATAFPICNHEAWVGSSNNITSVWPYCDMLRFTQLLGKGNVERLRVTWRMDRICKFEFGQGRLCRQERISGKKLE